MNADLNNQQVERARLSLEMMAYGDALGMPTQDLPPTTIAEDYGWVDGLIPAGPRQEIAAGAPAGMVTDDTEQAFLMADIVIRYGSIPPHEIGQALLEWEKEMIRRGSLDLLGPSTKSAIAALEAGTPPSETGKYGTTNGAAMRISPIGIAFPLYDQQYSERISPGFFEAVVEASQVTHNTRVALQGAAFVAGAVSAGISGADRTEALQTGLKAAQEAVLLGNNTCAPDIYERALWAIQELAKAETRAEQIRILFHIIGTSYATHESVPAAASLCSLPISAREVLLLSANCGGDTDTIATMCGAILGACGDNAGITPEELALIRKQNNLDWDTTAERLIALRNSNLHK